MKKSEHISKKPGTDTAKWNTSVSEKEEVEKGDEKFAKDMEDELEDSDDLSEEVFEDEPAEGHLNNSANKKGENPDKG